MKLATKRKNLKPSGLLEANLELVRTFLQEVLKHPERVAHIPNNATVVLYPVTVGRKAA